MDSSFNAGLNGSVVWAVGTQPDGKIVIGGEFDTINGQTHNRIARLSASGIVEAAFNTGSGPDGVVRCLAIQADGKIVICGDFANVNGQSRNGIARLNADGTLESTATFDIGTGVAGPAGNTRVNCVAVQPDGRILLGGQFDSINGQARKGLARLYPDGRVEDPVSFTIGTGISGWLQCLTVQTDGKILIGGLFTSVNGQARGSIARLLENGTVESLAGFNPGTGVSLNDDGTVYAIAVQADGRILVGGEFSIVNGQARRGMARLLANGTLESTATFNPGTGTTVGSGGDVYNGKVNAIAVQTDGHILLGGEFTSYNGTGRQHFARLLGDGTLEGTATFNIGTGFNSPVRAIAQRSNGQILAGGDFFIVNGQSRARIAVLNNDAATEALTTQGTSRLQWLRGGASPEAGAVAFEYSANGTAWTSLGTGSRIAGGWERTGLNLPGTGQVRGRARTTGGSPGGGAGMVETTSMINTAINISGTQAYSQDFSSLGTGAVSWLDNLTIPGWYAQINNGATASGSAQASDGSTSAAGLLNLGTAGATDRALGSSCTGTGNLANIAYGVCFKNAGIVPVKLTQVSYAGEIWRTNSNTNPERYTLYYSISNSPVIDLRSGANTEQPQAGTGFTAVGAGANWISPVNAPASAALNGNTASNRTVVTFNTAAAIPSIQPGEYCMLKWTDNNESFTDGSQGIDDVVIQFTADYPVIAVTGTMNSSQNFNSLPNTAGTNWANSVTIPGWWLFRDGIIPPVPAPIEVSDGSSVWAAGVYSLGAAGSTERALGAAPTTAHGAYSHAAMYYNAGARPVKVTRVKYDVEVFKTSNVADTTTDSLAFSSRSATAQDPIVNNPGTGWTGDASLGFTYPVQAANAATRPPDTATVDKAPAGNIIAMPGEYLALRWTNVNDAGQDGYMGIDNVTIQFTEVAPVIAANASGAVRNDNGTPGNSVDDTFSFSVTVTQTYAGTAWSSDVPDSNGLTTGPYGAAKSFGPFPVSQSPLTIHFTDVQFPSAASLVTVTAPVSAPFIQTPPLPQTVARGQEAVFTVVATGSDLFYEWRRDNFPVPGGTGATLTIGSAQLGDEGNYTVRVSNSAGSAIGGPAKLTVYVPPGILQFPVAATGGQGQPAALAAAGEGTGALAWKWHKDGVEIAGATSATYPFPALQPWHAGLYTVTLSDGVQSASSPPVAVKVTPFPYNVWQGLSAYYPLNAPQPGTDFGPQALHAVNQGTVEAPDGWGRTNGARRFVASENNGMSTAVNALFRSQPAFTWAVWVKTSGVYGSAITRILSTEGPDGSGQAGFALYALSSGKFGAGLNWGGGLQSFETAATYPANVWRHVAATWDGSRVRLYVDGALAGSRDFPGVVLTSNAPLCMGHYRTGSSVTAAGHFDGWLDEVRFYNRVLTPGDLTQLRESDDAVDLDGDGLGDAWEARYGFSAAANESTGDADHDGASNLAEYLSGSSPVDFVSNFQTPQLEETIPGALRLLWRGSPARNYEVSVSPDLNAWEVLTVVPGGSGLTSLTVEATVRPVRRFYSVEVVP